MIHLTPWLIFLLIRIIYEVSINLIPLKRRLEMIRLNFFRRALDTSMLFNGHYVDVRTFYVLNTNMVPCICYIGEIDVTNAQDFICEHFKDEIKHVYQHSFFDHELKERFFNNNIFVLKQNRMIELQQNYVHVLHTMHDYEWVDTLVKDLAQFRTEQVAPVHTTVVGFAKQTTMN